jgi:hypothetical protein
MWISRPKFGTDVAIVWVTFAAIAVDARGERTVVARSLDVALSLRLQSKLGGRLRSIAKQSDFSELCRSFMMRQRAALKP